MTTSLRPALLVETMHAYYGSSHILQGVDLCVGEGRVVALLGRNGAGKTTTLRAIMNLLGSRTARLELHGRSIAGASTVDIVRAGMTLVLEDRGVFPSLTVGECLRVAAGGRRGQWTVARVLDMFPRLAERLGNRCSQLSGGEQQMLAIGRAMLLDPKVLLLDEPTQGLAPIIVRELLASFETLKRVGVSMLIVEQNFEFATRLADDIVILGKGVSQWHGLSAELRDAREVKANWLGV